MQQLQGWHSQRWPEEIMSKLHLEQPCKQSREREVISMLKISAMRGLKPSREEEDLDSVLSVQAERSSWKEHLEERNNSI